MVGQAFVSYVREDEALADLLARDLQSRGVDVWLDRAQIAPGVRWKDAIRQAIRQGGFYLPCFSKRYALREKTYMKEELLLAIEELHRRPVTQGWFIPVLFDGEGPDESIGKGQTLRDLQWVDLSRGWAHGIDSIVKSVAIASRRKQQVISLTKATAERVRTLEERRTDVGFGLGLYTDQGLGVAERELAAAIELVSQFTRRSTT